MWTYFHPLLEAFYSNDISNQTWMEIAHFPMHIVTKMNNENPNLD